MTHSTENCPELPAPPGRIATFAIVALMVGGTLAWFIERPTGPTCTGTLQARTTFVASTVEGTLAGFSLPAGSMVQIGDPIVEISDSQLERDILAKQREIVSFQSELERALVSAKLELNWRLRTLDAEICEVQLRSASFLKEKYDHELQRNMLADVLSGESFVMLNGNDSLFESMVLKDRIPKTTRLATALEYETAANHAEVSAVQVEICKAREERLVALKQQLPDQVRQTVGVDVAESNVARAEQELTLLIEQRDALVVTSPAIGQVGVFKVRRGDHLVPGTPIVELLDDAKRFLNVSVPSADITSFTIGTEVALVFPGNEQFTGQVFSIAPQAVSLDPSVSDSTIAVHVEQTGKLWPTLPIGSHVKVRLSNQ